MKVIFLDIDGVLNNYHTLGMDRYVPKPLIEGDAFHDHLSPYCMRALNDIINTTGAKVVVSSTWRYGETNKRLQALFEAYGFKGEVIGSTPSLGDKERGYEIQMWLNDNKKLNIESFVIIDDDSDMVHLLKYLIITGRENGLTKKYTRQAVKILNNDIVYTYFNLIRIKCRRIYGYINYVWYKVNRSWK